MGQNISDRFWEKWHKANELDRVDLIKTLTLPAKIEDDGAYNYQCAILINSFLCDLADYLAKSEALGGKG